MAFTLEKVVPWGRSLAEYGRMFALTTSDLGKHVLGCADGPASFNAELTASRGTAVSCDPIYAHSADEIRQRIDITSEEIVEQARQNAHTFVWCDDIPDPEALGRHRMAAMNRFLDDYEAGLRESRYVTAELPRLPFADDSFDCALCSHFLFLYSKQLSTQFHIESIQSMIRVAGEVRIFPVTDLGANLSRHLDPVMTTLRELGHQAETTTVPYEFQRGANQMLRIIR